MTTEKTEQKNEQEERDTTASCCSPQKFAEMMTKCGADMKCECGGMMAKMMKGGYRPSVQK